MTIDGPDAPDEPDQDLRAWLLDRGADPDRALDAIVAERADALASDMVLARNDRMSLRELAQHAGIPVDSLSILFHDLGVAVPDPDRPQFGEADARFVAGMVAAPS